MPRFVLIGSASDLDREIGNAAGHPIDVVSAPEIGIQAGALWWKALVDRYQEHVGTAILDCGDSPGRTMGALRAGVRDVLFRGDDSMVGQIAEIAQASGGRLWRAVPEVIGMGLEPVGPRS